MAADSWGSTRYIKGHRPAAQGTGRFRIDQSKPAPEARADELETYPLPSSGHSLWKESNSDNSTLESEAPCKTAATHLALQRQSAQVTVVRSYPKGLARSS